MKTDANTMPPEEEVILELTGREYRMYSALAKELGVELPVLCRAMIRQRLAAGNFRPKGRRK